MVRGVDGVISVFVELSGESLELARAEAGAAAESLGGAGVEPLPGAETLFEVALEAGLAPALAGRLALAHRCLVRPNLSPEGLPLPGPSKGSGAFRPFRRPSGGERTEVVHRAARAWKEAGGTIDLDHPDHRFWNLSRPELPSVWLEEVAPIDRPAVAARRISALPFRRPVGLDPRLARAAANLARPSSGSRVVDPFVGTGALLAEAALLGARVVGVDRDPVMVQGALRNFAHLGVTAESMTVGDSGEVEFEGSLGPFDALLSDLPYGRSSGTGGEDAGRVAARVLPRWAERIRPGGRMVLIVPGGEDPVGAPWRRVLSVSVRVHRSLTREFRVYERSD
jgi:tRNA (guanine10-N2)-dimethyltransferase